MKKKILQGIGILIATASVFAIGFFISITLLSSAKAESTNGSNNESNIEEYKAEDFGLTEEEFNIELVNEYAKVETEVADGLLPQSMTARQKEEFIPEFRFVDEFIEFHVEAWKEDSEFSREIGKGFDFTLLDTSLTYSGYFEDDIVEAGLIDDFIEWNSMAVELLKDRNDENLKAKYLDKLNDIHSKLNG